MSEATGSQSETTWGDSLTGTALDDNPVTFRQRVVTVNERYGRVWIVRAVTSYARALVLPGDLAQTLVRVREGQGRVSVPWTYALVGADGETQTPTMVWDAGGFSFPISIVNSWMIVAASAFTIDVELTLAGAASPLTGTASVWIAPGSPVYPPGLRT